MNNTVIPNKNIKTAFRQMVAHALHQDFSLALWKLPHQPSVYVAVGSTALSVDEFALEELKPGFAIAPFSPTGQKYFIEATHLFEIEQEIIEHTTGQFLEQTQEATASEPVFYPGKPSHAVPSSSEYQSLVELCINALEAGSFEKVVAAHQRQTEVPHGFDLLTAFDSLCAKYPNAMVSLVSDKNLGTWLGATPELLVSTDKHQIFRTVALAGTQSFNPDVPLRSVRWTQKEIEEQALVERYIISCFKKIRVREYEEHGPKTVQAGNLIHLKSEFEVNMKEVNYPQLGSVMLKLLHPTSAVCGMPLESSLKFLEAHEPMQRELYAGYLGPVNINSECHLFVNLRCMKWCGSHLVQFAGAGITIDSIPEEECREVELKFNTLRSAIGI